MSVIKPDHNHEISKETAAKWRENYKKNFPNSLCGGIIRGSDIKRVIDQEGAEDMAYCFILQDENKPEKLAVAIYGADGEGKLLKDGVILDIAGECPPWCD
jgi:hypothetical protein